MNVYEIYYTVWYILLHKIIIGILVQQCPWLMSLYISSPIGAIMGSNAGHVHYKVIFYHLYAWYRI